MSTLPTDLRSRLGLAPDATDAVVLAALDKRLTAPSTQPTQPDEDTDADEDTSEVPAKPVAASTLQHSAEIKRLSEELAAIKAEQAETVKRGLFDGAVRAGKIRPAERKTWEVRYDAAPVVIAEIIDSLAPGVAVPIVASAAGITGPALDETESDSEEFDALFTTPVKG